jgi:hypothetical protein
MTLTKLTRDLLGGRRKSGVPTISFHKRGIGVLSRQSVQKLEIRLDSKKDSLIDIYQGDKISEFFVSKGTTYQLRHNGTGGAVFNSVGLCNLVIDKTWTVLTHTFNEPIPKKIVLCVCDKPVDDEENCNVYALLRKKI